MYITAFAPDQGESVAKLTSTPLPGAPVPRIVPPVDGFLALDKAKFVASFAADVKLDLARFMADSQVPWGLDALNGAITEPAWKSRPSWYLVATDDRMISVDVQRMMARRAGARTADHAGSHAIYVAARRGREVHRSRCLADPIAPAAEPDLTPSAAARPSTSRCRKAS